EARAVKALADRLGVPHRTVRWTAGAKPQTGLQERARMARYGLLAREARRFGAPAILTAHTLDDQAETVLIRMARGSGLSGLAAMARIAALDPRILGSSGHDDRPVLVVRPFLHLPKARLVETLHTARLAFADDPSNRDPRFTRARLREMMPHLA